MREWQLVTLDGRILDGAVTSGSTFTRYASRMTIREPCYTRYRIYLRSGARDDFWYVTGWYPDGYPGSGAQLPPQWLKPWESPVHVIIASRPGNQQELRIPIWNSPQPAGTADD